MKLYAHVRVRFLLLNIWCRTLQRILFPCSEKFPLERLYRLSSSLRLSKYLPRLRNVQKEFFVLRKLALLIRLLRLLCKYPTFSLYGDVHLLHLHVLYVLLAIRTLKYVRMVKFSFPNGIRLPIGWFHMEDHGMNWSSLKKLFQSLFHLLDEALNVLLIFHQLLLSPMVIQERILQYGLLLLWRSFLELTLGSTHYECLLLWNDGWIPLEYVPRFHIHLVWKSYIHALVNSPLNLLFEWFEYTI